MNRYPAGTHQKVLVLCVFFPSDISSQLMIGKHFSALLFAHQFRQKENTGRLFCLFISSLALFKEEEESVKEMNRENDLSLSLSGEIEIQRRE